ncbi:MAG TPA: peptidylprolyl isomerase [Spirochaetia bacterium]|nr:peptidylprolyl isomerase [Spirochaetia bacterium]
MEIRNNTVVTFDYTLTDDEGEVLDSSEGGSPLSVLQGSGSIVPGLEQALDGHSSGDHLNVEVSAEQGYGEYDPGMIFTIEKDKLPQDEPLEEGMQFQAETPAGLRVLTLTGLTDAEATLDANHPLAGQNLHFEVWVRDVREATGDEIEHGHAHDGHGHSHDEHGHSHDEHGHSHDEHGHSHDEHHHH